jgi:trimeric autotransporter adhesin
MGFNSLYANTSGYYNTSIGAYSLDDLTTGSFNVALGYGAASDVGVATSYSTYIGYNADNSGTTSWTNSSCLGYNSRITASNQVRIGNSSVTSIGGYAAWTNLSDKRFKNNIQEDVHGLDFIMKLKPITYNLNVDKLDSFLGIPDSLRLHNANLVKSQKKQTGFAAQDVEAAAIECNFDFSGIDKPQSENDHYSLRYSEFVVPIVKAIQEQQTIILNQQTEINILKQELQNLKNQMSND